MGRSPIREELGLDTAEVMELLAAMTRTGYVKRVDRRAPCWGLRDAGRRLLAMSVR
jgi:hypothetical protein